MTVPERPGSPLVAGRAGFGSRCSGATSSSPSLPCVSGGVDAVALDASPYDGVLAIEAARDLGDAPVRLRRAAWSAPRASAPGGDRVSPALAARVMPRPPRRRRRRGGGARSTSVSRARPRRRAAASRSRRRGGARGRSSARPGSAPRPRSTTFDSSRTLSGQSCRQSAWNASGSNARPSLHLAQEVARPAGRRPRRVRAAAAAGSAARPAGPAPPPARAPPLSSATRLVAAMMRTSASTTRVDPSGVKRRSCRKRSSFDCSSSGMSPISSRNSVPPSASSTRPILRALRGRVGALLVAEQLALDELARDRGAVDRDELARRARCARGWRSRTPPCRRRSRRPAGSRRWSAPGGAACAGERQRGRAASAAARTAPPRPPGSPPAPPR